MSFGAKQVLLLVALVQLSTSIEIEEDILSGLMKNTKIKKRSDHQPDKKLMTIEIFTVIDNSILKNFLELSKGTTDIEKKENAKKSILFIFTHIMEGVKNAYENIKSEKYKFTTKWVGALIAEDSKEASFIRNSMLDKDLINGTKILFNMMSWVSEKKRERNVNKRLPKFDFLAAFTRYLVKFGPILQPGLAGRNKVCSNASPAIIRYTNVVETIRILSHELAHALNANHDGTWNACKKRDGFIMGSHELDNSRNESRNFNVFSECSVSSFEEKIDVLKQRSNCLINEAEDFNRGQEKDIFLQLQPGQIYDLDDQCKLTYGPESFYIGGSEKGKDVCAGFNCDKGFIRGAMDGTMCLNGAWCLKGRCSPDSRAPRVPEHCINGDSKLPLELESAELQCKDLVNENRELCKNETVKSHCCLTCDNINNQTLNGECHDAIDECASLEPRDCYNEYYAAACCNTCRNLVKNPSDADCLYGDKGVNCSSLVPEVCHISTRYCCQTCSDYLSPTTLPTSSINNTTTYSETTNVSKIFNALLTDSENRSKAASLPSESTTSSPKKLCPKKQIQTIAAAN